MPDIATSLQRPRKRKGHPCLPAFLQWAAYFVCAVIAAIVGHSPAFLLLALPTVAPLYLLGENILRGYPQVDAEATRRLDRILIEVGGLDAFLVTVQDQRADPVSLRRGKRPRIIAETGFISGCSDELLRGIAALQHASLRCSRIDRRRWVATFAMFALVCVVAILIVVIAPYSYSVWAGIASVGVSTWLFGAIVSAYTWLPSAGAVFLEVDPLAARLVNDPFVVADAVAAIAAWRIASREDRSLPATIAYRLVQPVFPSWHEPERIARLRATANVQTD